MSIIITPSPEEVKVAISSAVDRAYSLGYTDGEDYGYEQGFTKGVTSNNEKAFNDGYNKGLADGSVVADEALQDEYEKGYEYGYDEGKNSMIDESKMIEKTASGTGIVALDDVSELPHDISVQLTGDNVGGKEVTVCGRNLLDGSDREKSISENGVQIQYLPEEDCYVINGTARDNRKYYVVNKKLMYINDYVSIQTFVVDGTITNPNGLSAYFYVGGADTPEPDGENWKACNISENTTKTSDTSKKYLCSTWFFFYGGTTFANYKVKIQVEKGTQTSSYTPYEGDTYTANADGKVEGIKSLSPYMTFVCNETDISVDYHKSWGMQTEYDKLWDTFQNNGGEVNYYVAFGYRKFTDKNYNPKHPIRCLDGLTPGQMMFYNAFDVTDTKVPIYANATNLTQAFMNSGIKRIPLLSVKETTTYSNTFANCIALEHITFEGVIGQDIGFSACPLSRASMDNVFEHLKRFGTVWTKNEEASGHSYEWCQDSETGTYPFDKIKVVLNEGLNPAEYQVRYMVGEAEGQSGLLLKSFDNNGVCELEPNFADDRTGFLQLSGVENQDYDDISDYTVYEGIIHEAPATPPSVTLKQTAIDAAYTEEEWNAKAKEVQGKGWEIKTV